MSDTYTCASCGETFDKGWSDEEAAAEAEELFPGIDISAEAGVVCDGCYQHIMGRARAEAPELIGPGWRVGTPVPSGVSIPDFPGFVASLTVEGYTLNPCPDGCQDKGTEHAHLRTPDGDDMIVWADGRWSGYDLTQPATLIYPAVRRPPHSPFRSSLDAAWSKPGPFGSCYQTASGMMVHVRPGCRCKS